MNSSTLRAGALGFIVGFLACSIIAALIIISQVQSWVEVEGGPDEDMPDEGGPDEDMPDEPR